MGRRKCFAKRHSGIRRRQNSEYKMSENSQLLLHDTTDGKTDSDEEDPDLNDVVVLDVDGVQTTVVTDWDNNCLKSFYTKNNQTCHSKLQLHKSPMSVTQIMKNQVMVTVPELYQIVRIEVNPNLLRLSIITTEKPYYGLSFLAPSSLVASGLLPSSVDILTMDGRILKSFTKYKNKNLFFSPGAVVAACGRIFVCDWNKKYILCLTIEGEVLWEYSSTGEAALDFPVGLAAFTKATGILFTDSNSKKVIHLGDSGQFVRDVLTARDALIKPSGIHISGDGKLTLCDKGQIKVYVLHDQ